MLRLLTFCTLCAAFLVTDASIVANWHRIVSKIEQRIDYFSARNVDIEHRSLIIYHIGDIGLVYNSLDIAINNLNFFVSAIMNQTASSKQKAFFLFNVVDDHNPLLSMIPTSKSNVALAKWNTASSDLGTHLKTLQMLGPNITSRFSTVIFSNQGVRGPLVKRQNNEWIGEFKKLLNTNNVGLVGPTMSCEVAPHIQTHMFAIRTTLIPFILSEMEKSLKQNYKSWLDLIAALEVGLTGVVMTGGYNVSSFLYSNRGHPYFNGQCLKYRGPANQFDKNPTGWCGVTPEELIFIKWGGEPMRTPGMVCNTTLLLMEDILDKVATTEPALHMIVPEALLGGSLYPTFKEFAQEAWIDRHLVPSTAALPHDDKVCFLVRVTNATLAKETVAHENPTFRYMNKGAELLVTSKLRKLC
jgi:hypothetical protein